MSVLQDKGFTVDPNTFTFTNLNVSAHGDVTATVSTCVTKSFEVDQVTEEQNMEAPVSEDLEGPVLMTEGARVARRQRRNNILSKYAQAMPGMPTPAAPPAGPVEPVTPVAPVAPVAPVGPVLPGVPCGP